jgi:8-oxo-dGTP pyrophosphatase MutT (NUDIX family)
MSTFNRKSNGWVTLVEYSSTQNTNLINNDSYWYFELDDYVNVVVRSDFDEVALVKQFRIPIGGITLELPAGMVDLGESPEKAAIRECKEEIGLISFRSIVHISTNFTDTGRLSNKTHLYFIDGAKCDVNLKTEQNIEVIWQNSNLLFSDRYLRTIDHIGHVASLLLVKKLGYFS